MCKNPPKTLKEWYDWASKLENNWRKTQRILGRSRENLEKNNGGKKKEEPRRRFNFIRKDPNAMDVDALNVEKRKEMMRKGLCFGCEKPGHLNKDCPKKRRPSTSQAPPSYTPPNPMKKLAAKELYTHIRSLTALMNEEEKEEFYQEAEKEGF